MSETIFHLLTRLSETGPDAILTADGARPFYGRAFDRLLNRRVLEELAPVFAWDVCHECDCGLPYRPIRARGDVLCAECPLDPAQDVELQTDDLRTFRIGESALAREIATAAELAREPAEIGGGIWFLGRTDSGRAVFLILARAVVLREGLVPTLRQAARGAPVTLLGPGLPVAAVLRFEEAGIHHVVTTGALETQADRIIITAASLEPERLAPALVYHASTGRVEVHGHILTLSHQLAPVFLRLVRKTRMRDPVVSGPELEGETGREAKDLVRELRAAFVAGGLSKDEAEELIPNIRSRGWRIGLKAAHVVVAD